MPLVIPDVPDWKGPPAPVDTGGGGSNNGGGMEPRVAKLEEHVSDIRVDVASVKATLEHLATKADVAAIETKIEAGFSSSTRWVVGVGIAAVAIVVSALKFLH